MNIISGLPYTDRNGQEIYTDFRNMLNIERLLQDNTVDDRQKLLLSLHIFYGETLPENLDNAIQELDFFYKLGEELEENGSNKKVFDFQQDANFLVASFLTAYNIDLTDETYYLHWWKFIALFLSLPENTRIMQIIQDRCVDTSKLKGETKKFYEQRKKAAALKTSTIDKKPKTAEEAGQQLIDRIDKLYSNATIEKGG